MKIATESRSNKSMKLALLGIGMCVASGVSSAACLQKIKQVKGVGNVATLMVAPRREVAEYAAQGFTEVACPSDMSVFRQYVDMICSSTGAGGNPPMNTAVMFGRNRERACTSGRLGLSESGG